MKKITIILITTIAILYSCQKEPSASFTVSSSSVNVGENVTFTNTSLDANSFLWDFGDGGSSITQSPSHTYNTAGTYTVTLTAFSNNVNKKDIVTNEIIVSPLKPALTTSSATSITQTSAVCGGNVTSDGGTTITARGVCWSTSQNPTTSDNHTTDGGGTGTFTSSITNLSVGITYYARAYATNSAGTDYGNQISFKTNPSTYPTVNTSSVSNVTQTAATCGGNVTNDGGATVTGRGVCWSTSQNPTINDSHTTDGSGTGSFTSSITNLSVGITYYVRAYATNSAGTDYGNQISFTTNPSIFPTVSTSSISNVTQTTATSGGNVTSDGGATVTAKGVCWSISENPTITDGHTSDGTGTGSFTSNITGLLAGTTYYVRAYATNSEGTAYGQSVSFTTQIALPTVTTTAISSITENSAVSGGNVTSDGGATVTARGVCWSTSQNPTTSNNYTTNGSGIGSFTSSITGLTAGTTYYVKAYATNSAGTAYGQSVSFTTQIALPTVTTTAISSITENSAVNGGNVTSDGGATVTARGVCWNTSQNPIISGNHTTDGTGTGSFTSSITGLSANTKYYVRAYATNSVGTAYGENISFTTIGPVTDYDGNVYQTVQIGNQVWMAENLKTTHYADGTEIPLVTDNTAWANLGDNNTDDAYCYYNNNANNESDTYGALYTWAATMGDNAVSSNANPSGVQGVCPDGWHLPSGDEWTELEDYITADGHSGTEGTALKSTSGWYDGGNGTDNYGFSALPGGYRSYGGAFGDVGYNGYWWGSTEYDSSSACHRHLYYDGATVYRYYHLYSKSKGLSVRCVRD